MKSKFTTYYFIILVLVAFFFIYSTFLQPSQLFDITPENHGTKIFNGVIEKLKIGVLNEGSDSPKSDEIPRNVSKIYEKISVPQTTQSDETSNPPDENFQSETPKFIVELEAQDLLDAQHESQNNGTEISTMATATAQVNLILPTSTAPNLNQSNVPPSTISPKINASALNVIHFYEPGFSYPNLDLCPNQGRDLRLMIFITSEPSHTSARNAIRLTWGHFSQRTDTSIAFLIGKTSDNGTLELIETEKKQYNDLIIANYIDAYDNLTLKTISMLHWAKIYCNQSKFILKTDDDMFINVVNLHNFITKIEKNDTNDPKIYGRHVHDWRPVRDNGSHYYISREQFELDVFPDFTTGPAYLFATRLATPLFETGLTNKYLKLEDVFLTGIIALQIGIKRQQGDGFINDGFSKDADYCTFSRVISIHGVSVEAKYEFWKKLLDGQGQTC